MKAYLRHFIMSIKFYIPLLCISPFILECMREFYATYDDKLVRWNGAHLLSRVHNRLKQDGHSPVLKPKIAPPWKIFPISSENISRWFSWCFILSKHVYVFYALCMWSFWGLLCYSGCLLVCHCMSALLFPYFQTSFWVEHHSQNCLCHAMSSIKEMIVSCFVKPPYLLCWPVSCQSFSH